MKYIYITHTPDDINLRWVACEYQTSLRLEELRSTLCLIQGQYFSRDDIRSWSHKVFIKGLATYPRLPPTSMHVTQLQWPVDERSIDITLDWKRLLSSFFLTEQYHQSFKQVPWHTRRGLYSRGGQLIFKRETHQRAIACVLWELMLKQKRRDGKRIYDSYRYQLLTNLSLMKYIIEDEVKWQCRPARLKRILHGIEAVLCGL